MLDIPQKHIAFHLLRHCLNFSKVQYWMRTVPREKIEKLLKHFDSKLRAAIEELIHDHLSDEQWQQVQLLISKNDLGLRSAHAAADLAFIASK